MQCIIPSFFQKAQKNCHHIESNDLQTKGSDLIEINDVRQSDYIKENDDKGNGEYEKNDIDVGRQ